MKLRLLSDLHCEGFQYEYHHKGEDVLVLAGDIHTKCRHDKLITQVPEHVQIMFVAGNHEYYHGTFEAVNEYLSGLQDKYKNFHFLNNNSAHYGGVEFFGGTMYTDFSLCGPALSNKAAEAASKGINDFYSSKRLINGQRRPWTVADHVSEHGKFKEGLQGWLNRTNGSKRVVVSHFVPSPKAIHPRWGGASSLLNSYFTADMEHMMGWEGLWLYGHTHDSGDNMVGGTRVVGNPKGYGNENEKEFNDSLILEI